MYLIRFSLAFILLVGIFACKDKGTQTNDIQDTAEDFPDLIENEFVRIEKGPDNNLYEYQIRTEAEKPVLIQKNGQAKIYDNLEDISYDDFSKNSFILLPAAHSLLENPFKNESAISALAPTIWGRSLVAKKEELNNILFLIEKNYRAPEHPTLETEKINELFGDYTKNLLDEGKHKVYSISFKGRELALKENADELEDMHKLRFTDGVARVYAAFYHNNEKKMYMIMEKGLRDLVALRKASRKLDEQQIVETVATFKRLTDAQKILKISNQDIKPGNILQVKRGENKDKFVVIDISAISTNGYHGSEGQLLARALFENQMGEPMIAAGPSMFLRYYDHALKYRSGNIASPIVWKAWLRVTCEEITSNDGRCGSVNSFNDLFLLLPKSKLFEYAMEINRHNKDQRGSTDCVNSFNTKLPLPYIQDISDSDWEKYFSNREKIGEEFCLELEDAREIGSGIAEFSYIIKGKYISRCKKQPDDSVIFVNDFRDAKDPGFRTWIEDALVPHVKRNTIGHLLRTGPELGRVMDKMIEDNLGSTAIGTAILGLYRHR